MKKAGNKCDFNSARDAAIMRAFRAAARCTPIYNYDILAREVASSPCERFWVSEERATIVVSEIIRGVDSLSSMLPTKRRMFEEIYRRVLHLRSHRQNSPLGSLVAEVVNSPAPEFYLSPRYVRDLICQSLKLQRA